MPDTTTAGTVRLDVRGSGSASKPEVRGQIQLQKVAYIPSDAPIGVENLNGTLDVDNGRVQIRQLTGQSGGGTISLGGFLDYQPALRFDVAINAQSVRLLYPQGLRTVLNGNLTAAGTTNSSLINGRVLIDSVSFTPDFDLANFIASSNTPSVPSATPTAADNMRLDIAVQSTSDLQASSSTVSLQGAANLRLIGTAADPVITGRADLNSGDVFFNNQRFVLERGIVNFINPHQTEPNVNILITTTIQQYNLSLTILGPVDKLTTSYTSDPPLPPVDIINLIARGQTTEQPAAPFDANQVIASELAGQVSSRVGKFAGISSLTIDPTLGSNTQNPSARVAIQQRVTRNFVFTFSTDVTDPEAEIVQGEYQLNKRWSVSASRDQYGGVAVDGRFHTTF
jgi:translocation and assembly module TamB